MLYALSSSSSSSNSSSGGSGGDGYMGPFYGPQCKIRLYDTPSYTHFANGVLVPTILQIICYRQRTEHEVVM